MQRITKFSAIIGFLAVVTFAVGFFMYMPNVQDGISGSPMAVFAFGESGDGGCCGGGGDGDGDGDGDVVIVPRPVCTLNATPTIIDKGDSVTLTWTTKNANNVSINQGVGPVARAGNTSVSPTETTTYTLTASGRGGKVTCSKTVTVRVPMPVCTLLAYPKTINAGQSSTLTWTTDHANSISINQGVGSVSADGNTSVSPTQTTTYTLTASGYGKTVQCPVTITVITETPDPVCNSFTASPNSFGNGGGNTTLNWETTNVDAVSIDQGVGSVSVDGSKSVFVGSSKTFTLTATKGAKTATCNVPVTVSHTQNFSCDAFTASPSSFGKGGGNTTLNWNTTGATSVSIDQGVGSVSVDGSQSVAVNQSKTYTLTASNGQNTLTCNTSVTVETDNGCTSNCGGGGGGGSSRPSCKLFKASDKDIEKGDKVTLRWETSRGNELIIKDNHGDEIFDTSDDDEVDEGDVIVYPKKDTTYTLKVEGKSNKTDSCTVKVNVDEDDVRVTTVRDRQPITTITFRDVPYTGFEAGPMLAGFFYALLALWGLVASYIIVVKKGSVMGFSLATVGRGGYMSATHSPKAIATPVVARTATAFAPANLPVATDEDEEEEEKEEEVTEEDFSNEESSSLENRAFASGIILSKDALEVVNRAGGALTERVTILDAVIARAKESFPREDGWIALDKGRIQTLFS